jgi:cytochrome c oxidase subunit 2
LAETSSATSPEAMAANIEREEKQWALIMVGVCIAMIFVIVAMSLIFLSHPPSNVERIDPDRLQVSGEFVEANLGTELGTGGPAIVRAVTRMFNFDPSCLLVPAGSLVTFRMTSPDVIHGAIIPTTNFNTMIIPGYVSEVTTRFDRPGIYRMPCHEFCGLGHHGMWADIRVVDPIDWPFDKARARCDRE